ncbi:precorrin-3B synthase [Gordonia polyisoprenivorans]|uniref:precorrin-3B synthase n=1 Tax=Gordonia polyisoprenivorans TaxID=84595 RepID=UPI0003829DE2|nr:precorrin-3B synthase [Gordonia polyisoprenivorans]
MTEPRERSADDRCPGVFTPHPAADGALARVRLPGGVLSAAQMQTLAEVSAQHGDGYLELTARANIQLRGISDVEAVADALTAAGLVPDGVGGEDIGGREKIRNIVVSPLTGRIGGHADASPIAAALDAELRRADGLDGLSGRFLFGVDDGRGDVARHRPDVCAVLRHPAETGVADIVVDGEVAGSVDTTAAVAPALLDVARAMAALTGPGRWRIHDLDAATRVSVIDAARRRLGPPGDQTWADVPATGPVVGWFEQDDGRVLLGAVVELGRLPSRLAEFLAAVGAPITITTDREILLCDLTEPIAETVVRVLAPMGLIFDAASPWVRVTSCAGAPGCANSHAPVRTDLANRVAVGEPVTDREHWVGCERGCGSPTESHLRVEAGPDGYHTRRVQENR